MRILHPVRPFRHPPWPTATPPLRGARPSLSRSDAGFWKDRSGVVHLQGAVGCTGNATESGAIFTLPSGYRPAGIVRWGALSNNAAISQIAVLNSGEVVYDGPDNNSNDDYVSLDGFTFRAEG